MSPGPESQKGLKATPLISRQDLDYLLSQAGQTARTLLDTNRAMAVRTFAAQFVYALEEYHNAESLRKSLPIAPLGYYERFQTLLEQHPRVQDMMSICERGELDKLEPFIQELQRKTMETFQSPVKKKELKYFDKNLIAKTLGFRNSALGVLESSGVEARDIRTDAQTARHMLSNVPKARPSRPSGRQARL